MGGGSGLCRRWAANQNLCEGKGEDRAYGNQGSRRGNGISRQNIRFYERQGLLHPARNKIILTENIQKKIS